MRAESDRSGSSFILHPSNKIEFRSAGGLAAAMPEGSQVGLVGPLNWLIRSAGLVSWDDLFDGNGDPRDFDRVVRRKGLTVPQLVKAGIAEGVARRAGSAGKVMVRSFAPVPAACPAADSRGDPQARAAAGDLRAAQDVDCRAICLYNSFSVLSVLFDIWLLRVTHR